MKHKLLPRLASLALCLSICSCAGLPKGLTPKPDIRPVQTRVEQAHASVGRARTNLSKERESEQRVSDSLRKAKADLGRAGDSQAVKDAQASLQEAEKQRLVSLQYREWADTELASSWRYLDEAKGQIVTLGTAIDKSHENERVAVAAVEKWKPIIDQVNSFWGLGAFAYGAKRLASHLFILVLVLGVGGAILFFVFPAAIPFVVGIFRGITSTIGRVFSIFRRK